MRLAEAPSFGKPIVVYDAISVGAQSYLSLAREIIGRSGKAPADAGESLGKVELADVTPPVPAES